MWELWKTKIESTWGETESRVWVSWELRLLRVRLCERGETESRGQRAVAWSTKTREGEKEQKMRTVDWDIGFLSKRCVLQLFLFLFLFQPNGAFRTFCFFCFLNFGLNRPVRRRYRWLWPIRTDSALIGAYRAEKKKRKGTRHPRAGSGVARRTPRRCFISTAHSGKSRKILDSPYSNKS